MTIVPDKKRARVQHPSSPDIMTTPEAAAYIQVTVGALEQLRHRGCGPIYSKTKGVGVRYMREDLDAYIKAGRVRPLPPPQGVKSQPS